MYATIRRYEGTDKARSEEIAGKVTEKFSSISKLPGFSGYFMIDGGEGVLTSVGLFETSDQAHASTRLAATWIRRRPRRRAPEHADDHGRPADCPRTAGSRSRQACACRGVAPERPGACLAFWANVLY